MLMGDFLMNMLLMITHGTAVLPSNCLIISHLSKAGINNVDGQFFDEHVVVDDGWDGSSALRLQRLRRKAADVSLFSFDVSSQLSGSIARRWSLRVTGCHGNCHSASRLNSCDKISWCRSPRLNFS